MTRTSSPAARAAATDPDPDERPSFDRAALLERCAGRPELMRAVLASFRVESRELLRGIQAAGQRGNALLAHEFALTLRSAAANVGALRAFDAAAAVVAYCAAAPDAPLQPVFAPLAAELQRFEIEAAPELAANSDR